jgi:tRNA threonylcarbamoyladenosine biosynthesis protein TsaE
MKRLQIRTEAAAETERVAELLAPLLAPGDVVGLSGQLGSGKTCFVRGLARGLGSDDWVCSPTFVFLHIYRGRVPLRHFDLYRIGSGSEWETLAFEDGREGTITVVEWVEKAPPDRLGDHLVLELSILGENCRQLEFRAMSEKYVEFLSRLSNALGARLLDSE